MKISAPQTSILHTFRFDTPIGEMMALANDQALLLLEFADHFRLAWRLELLEKQTRCQIIEARTPLIDMIHEEMDAYFSGKLKVFKTLLAQSGTSFQSQVWNALRSIDYGKTRSYLEQAKILGLPKAFRAVANANGANRHAIIVPCHRVINSNGKLGGYGGGLERKQWLLNHEKRYAESK